MRPIILLTAALVASCAAPPRENGGAPPSDPSAARRAGTPAGEYVPRPQPESDERPWASAFVNNSFGESGIRGTGDGRALSWLTWGEPLRGPAVGAVAILDYGKGRGHVGLVVGSHDGRIVLLGGDHSNSVNTTAFAPEEITAYRWPSGQPLPAQAYALPRVRPHGAADFRGGPPRGAAAGAVPTGDASAIDTMEYRSVSGEQSLQVKRLAEDRIRFQLQSRSCTRAVTGTAYEIYPGDPQIDAEDGVGYPAREYFFWADSLGDRGLAIRLSLTGPLRARTTGWGNETGCTLDESVMHARASPRPPVE